MKRIALIVLAIGVSKISVADCKILKSDGSIAAKLGDLFFVALSKEDTCPQDVFRLKEVLSRDGLTVRPSMVANRGRHNPRLGSFSFFELAFGLSRALNHEVSQGQLYFGHFTGAASGVVDLDQGTEPGKLLVELIAWDYKGHLFNFYELIGVQGGANWFFRGNSKDALLDNRLLHLQPNPIKPSFGKTMRCSACHTSGGPIMKELEFPHNDWWVEARPLPLHPNIPSPDMKKWLSQVIDASEFASAVKSGQNLLESSQSFQDFKKSLSLQEQLRPLFCTTEINLVSSDAPLEVGSPELHAPAQFWIGSLFADKKPLVSIPKKSYETVIAALTYRFPETNRMDADHAWLGPVKGHSDFLQIDTLVEQGIIPEEFAADVLAVDFQNPLFSKTRCDLLRLVPEKASPGWNETFLLSLSHSSIKGAALLLENLTDTGRNKAFHLAATADYLESVRSGVEKEDFLQSQIRFLQHQRNAVFANEISKNPRGQILEPDFRVVFPVPHS